MSERGKAPSGPSIWNPVVGFTAANVWSQEYFDLNLAFASQDITLLVAASKALWSESDLQGCWLDMNREPESQPRVDAAMALKADEHYPYGPPEYWGPPTLFGLARLPGGAVVPCRSDCGLGGSYMYLSLDFNANALRCAPAPGDVEGGVAGRPLYDWLARIAARVHAVAPIQVGVIGWETSTPKREDIEAQRVAYGGLYGYLVPKTEELEYMPPGRVSAP